MSKRFGGSQSALVLAPLAPGKLLLSRGRVKVGMVYCRVRKKEQKVRCFRCFAFGHMSKACVGPDRTELCRRCGVRGHHVVNCLADSTTTKAFSDKLKNNPSSVDELPRLDFKDNRADLTEDERKFLEEFGLDTHIPK